LRDPRPSAKLTPALGTGYPVLQIVGMMVIIAGVRLLALSGA